MRRLHVLKSILVRTHADKILLTYLVFVVIAALIIQIVEPGINRFVDALWYCYAVISTAGFGDIVVTTFSAKVVSVLLTAYSIVVIALVTGVIVNYYNQLIQIRQKDTLRLFGSSAKTAGVIEGRTGRNVGKCKGIFSKQEWK